jgi:hypothetical protein
MLERWRFERIRYNHPRISDRILGPCTHQANANAARTEHAIEHLDSHILPELSPSSLVWPAHLSTVTRVCQHVLCIHLLDFLLRNAPSANSWCSHPPDSVISARVSEPFLGSGHGKSISTGSEAATRSVMEECVDPTKATSFPEFFATKALGSIEPRTRTQTNMTAQDKPVSNLPDQGDAAGIAAQEVEKGSFQAQDSPERFGDVSISTWRLALLTIGLVSLNREVFPGCSR